MTLFRLTLWLFLVCLGGIGLAYVVIFVFDLPGLVALAGSVVLAVLTAVFLHPYDTRWRE